MSNARSSDVSDAWCTSTAMTLEPACSTPAGMRKLLLARTEMVVVAMVLNLMVPAGRLSLATSTPLMYTTAPSSTFRKMEPPRDVFASALKSTVLRK